MRKILKFNEIFESTEKKKSWMPSVEEFNNIEPYKSLLEAIGGGKERDQHINYPQTQASITKGVRFIKLGATYDCKVSPVTTGEFEVNFTYGAYKIYSNIPFSTGEEREKAMELFILYSIGKWMNTSKNSGIFGKIEKFILQGKQINATGDDAYFYLLDSENIEGLDKPARWTGDTRERRIAGILYSIYILAKYCGAKGTERIIETISLLTSRDDMDLINRVLKIANLESIEAVLKKMRREDVVNFAVTAVPPLSLDIERFLKKSLGFTDSDIEDIELMRRMKRRSRYT
jgi:hypothetical protein